MEPRCVMKKRVVLTKFIVVMFLLAMMALGYLPALVRSEGAQLFRIEQAITPGITVE